MASDPIPESVRKMWDAWNIRALVIFSLSLQLFLVLFASFRKKTGNVGVHFLVWSAYLLADWVPTFTAGLIVNNIVNSNQSPASGADPVAWNTDLLALWSASILRHLGGTCSITAFALEDNEMWVRHLVSLVVQFTLTLYVLLCTLPNNKLLVPTIFALIGGFVRYAERVRSMYLASLDKYREEIVRQPYPVEDMYRALELDKLVKEEQSPLKRSDILKVAYHYFQIFKGLVVNMKYESHEQSREFISSRISPGDAYRVITRELTYMYDVFYTNQKAFTSVFGGYCWQISFICGAVVLGKFVHAGKLYVHYVDIQISYALFIVAIVLDVVVLYGDLFRQKAPLPLASWTFLDLLITRVNRMSEAFFVNDFHDELEGIWEEGQDIEIEPSVWHNCYDTPFIFRAWSESIYSHNLIAYCLKEQPRPISRPRPCCGVLCNILNLPFLVIKKIVLLFTKLGVLNPLAIILNMLGLKDILDRGIYVSKYPFDRELWKYIFYLTQQMSSRCVDPEEAKSISEARGNWALRVGEWSCDPDRLLTYIEGVDFDESVLLWHIATELCYNTAEVGSPQATGRDDKVFSKILSEYMMYLMVFQPGMVSTISGIFLGRFERTCNQTSSVLRKIHLQGVDNKLKESCQMIINSDTEVLRPASEEEGKSEAILLRARSLAKELNKLQQGEKWEIVSLVWLEMLMYAARNCRGDIHARSLSRGGELLTLVWLLMAHLGLICNQQPRVMNGLEQSV